MPEDFPGGERAGLKLGLDLSPWRGPRDFRLLWSAGAVTLFGGFLTMVALPPQLKALTGSARPWARSARHRTRVAESGVPSGTVRRWLGVPRTRGR